MIGIAEKGAQKTIRKKSLISTLSPLNIIKCQSKREEEGPRDPIRRGELSRRRVDPSLPRTPNPASTTHTWTWLHQATIYGAFAARLVPGTKAAAVLRRGSRRTRTRVDLDPVVTCGKRLPKTPCGARTRGWLILKGRGIGTECLAEKGRKRGNLKDARGASERGDVPSS